MESFFVSLTTHAHTHTHNFNLTSEPRRGGTVTRARGAYNPRRHHPQELGSSSLLSFVELTSFIELSSHIIQITHQENTYAQKSGYIHSPCTHHGPESSTISTKSPIRRQHSQSGNNTATLYHLYLVVQSTRQSSSPYYKRPSITFLIPAISKWESHSLVPASTMSFLQVYLPTHVPP